MDYALNKGEVISLSVKSRHVVRVNKGCIWLTCGDGCRDCILQQGHGSELGTGGLIVMEALSDSMVSIESVSSQPHVKEALSSLARLRLLNIR
ncbi:MAG: hypothetical protein CXR30_08635 [Geobacter sp.]|nr:MAG: hypothetical protein CXR30_08635 [Geobacter sp.]